MKQELLSIIGSLFKVYYSIKSEVKFVVNSKDNSLYFSIGGILFDELQVNKDQIDQTKLFTKSYIDSNIDFTKGFSFNEYLSIIEREWDRGVYVEFHSKLKLLEIKGDFTEYVFRF